MWVFQVKNIKLQATAKLSIVEIFYQINPILNTTNITEIIENSLNSVPCTNFNIGEKFSLIVFIAIQHNFTLLTFFAYCCKFLTGTRVQSEQLIAHNSAIVKKGCGKCYKHATLFHLAHNSHWCQLCNWEHFTK